MLTSDTETFQEGQRGKHLDAKHPDWRPKAIGAEIYQFAMTILRELGNEPNGRKKSSRGAEGRSADQSQVGNEMAGDQSPSAIGFSRSRKEYCITF